MKLEFAWDPAKAASNVQKHGITFEDASRVFLDPHHVSEIESFVEGEERWQTVGTTNGIVVVLVILTTSELDDIELIRIISARRADRKERRNYEENGTL